MNAEKFDIAITGAGPAGSTMAIALHGSGLKIALIDKSNFPRDKICGDALSPDVVNQLHKLPLETGPKFMAMEEKLWTTAVRFIAPNHSFADLSLSEYGMTGYVSRRQDFDHFMYQQAIASSDVTPITGQKVKDIRKENDGMTVELNDGTNVHAKLLIGADGAQSFVKKHLHGEDIDRKHHAAALRVYYEGVGGFTKENAVELHFLDELLPGYFWVFPLPDGRANVGLGMWSDHVAKHNINLKERLDFILTKNPEMKERFKHARPLESPKGFGLPLGSKKRKISGDGYLLLGDAASLINPLSGEGIANAIRSGRVAAEIAVESFKGQRFDAVFLKRYDKEIYRRMWTELYINYWLQRGMARRWTCNFIVEKAVENPVVQRLVISGFSIDHLKRKAEKPEDYLELKN